MYMCMYVYKYIYIYIYIYLYITCTIPLGTPASAKETGEIRRAKTAIVEPSIDYSVVFCWSSAQCIFTLSNYGDAPFVFSLVDAGDGQSE